MLPAIHAHLPCTTLLNFEECALSEKKKKKGLSVRLAPVANIEQVRAAKLLGVVLCGSLLFDEHVYAVFTARCTLVQSAVLRSHVVCLSVRLSVCL